MNHYYSKYVKAISALISCVIFLGIGRLAGCTDKMDRSMSSQNASGIELSGLDTDTVSGSAEISDTVTVDDTVSQSDTADTDNISTLTYNNIAIPDYSGSPSVEINDNNPFFTEEELSQSEPYESYSELDSLGRCSTASALIDKSIMPTEPRGEIGMIKPTGWHTVKYVNVDGHYLYNRCHLLAYELTGENANEKNLITGTRYMNVEGMLPYENMVAEYIKKTNNKVLYRVTPVFIDNELVARGVVMEGQGQGSDDIHFCIFCYNVQPDVTIDYATGESSSFVENKM